VWRTTLLQQAAFRGTIKSCLVAFLCVFMKILRYAAILAFLMAVDFTTVASDDFLNLSSGNSSCANPYDTAGLLWLLTKGQEKSAP
jgi:hypothetical protein